MSRKFQNQHFVSQVLSRRFLVDKKPSFRKYFLRTDTWSNGYPKSTFSAGGYTQMLMPDGMVNYDLENAFKKVEGLMHDTFKALDDAATRPLTTIPIHLYDNMCNYCAFLLGLSPSTKALSPIEILRDLEAELISGHGELFDIYFKFSDRDSSQLQREVLAGKRLIIDSVDHLQPSHRIVFKKYHDGIHQLFRQCTKWTILKSTENLPISDIAILEIPRNRMNILEYALPIAPHLLLHGVLPKSPEIYSQETSEDMHAGEASDWVDMICLSAQANIVSAIDIPDVRARRQRADRYEHNFKTIKKIDDVIAAGTKPFTNRFQFNAVSQEQYNVFVGKIV